MRKKEREREGVYEWERKREREDVLEKKRMKERKRESVCVRKREREKERECVCVHKRERGTGFPNWVSHCRRKSVFYFWRKLPIIEIRLL